MAGAGAGSAAEAPSSVCGAPESPDLPVVASRGGEGGEEEGGGGGGGGMIGFHSTTSAAVRPMGAGKEGREGG